jgi:hypothetical protein
MQFKKLSSKLNSAFNSVRGRSGMPNVILKEMQMLNTDFFHFKKFYSVANLSEAARKRTKLSTTLGSACFN